LIDRSISLNGAILTALPVRGTMKPIEFSKDEKAALVLRIQHFFDEELDQSIGFLKAEFVLDYFAKEVGAAYYKQGLEDAQIALSRRIDDFSEDVYQLQRDATD
jgi:uncharacterized protein (DUF2164 family)